MLNSLYKTFSFMYTSFYEYSKHEDQFQQYSSSNTEYMYTICKLIFIQFKDWSLMYIHDTTQHHYFILNSLTMENI